MEKESNKTEEMDAGRRQALFTGTALIAGGVALTIVAAEPAYAGGDGAERRSKKKSSGKRKAKKKASRKKKKKGFWGLFKKQQ